MLHRLSHPLRKVVETDIHLFAAEADELSHGKARTTVLLQDRKPRPWPLPQGAKATFKPDGYYLGAGGKTPLEVAVARAGGRPTESDVRSLWKRRRGATPSPLLLVVVWPSSTGDRASVCGTTGDDPAVYSDRDPGQVARLSALALEEPDHHSAVRFLAAYLPEERGGVRNVALFASHHLNERVPNRPDWADLCSKGQPLLRLRRERLVEALGFTVEPRGHAALLRAEGHATALAVFLDDGESPDTSAVRFNGITPVSWAIASATADNIPYVFLTRGSQVRVYTTRSGAGLSGKGGTAAFLELNLPLLTGEDAGYLPLLFSADSLAPGGLFETLLDESNDYATDLGSRLRSRVYDYAIPNLARALVDQHEGDHDPDTLLALYGQALLVLFRLMFVAYAEDRDLLPLRTNGLYRQRSLKHTARELADLANRHGWDDISFDEHATDLWDNVRALWTAVDKGRREWNVPSYNGGLFSSDAEVNAEGAAIAALDLSNSQFGPALVGLLVDEAVDGVFGPVDFASLDVREFGTIYEGLLESSFSVAPSDLTVDKDDAWVPAGPGDEVWVEQGAIYLHNRSGARKASGSYFTKPFAVNHLLENALDPALDRHAGRLEQLMAEGADDEAAAAFFDFRCVDLSMGSGHFLVAAVDRIERRLSGFLTEHRLPPVLDELDRLAAAAEENLTAAGLVSEGVDTNALLRRQIARRCIYGIDLNPVAVELARLALWVHTFVKGLPLTNLNHGLVVGNALTGFGTLDEVPGALDPMAGHGVVSLFADAFDEALTVATSAIGRFSATSEANAAEVRSARRAHQEALAAVEPVAHLFDYALGVRLGLAAIPTAVSLDDLHKTASTFDPAVITDLHAVHFPLAFPEVFSRARPGFDCILGNPPWQEATLEAPAFWARQVPGLRGLAAKQQTAEIERLRAERPDLEAEYTTEVAEQDAVRQALMAGPFPGMGTGDPDTYKAFIWRFVTLARDDGFVGVVLPRSALAAAGSAEWRRHVLANGRFADLCLLLNTGRWVFDMEPRYTVGLCSIDIGAHHAGTVTIRGPFSSFAQYEAAMQSGESSTVAAGELAAWSEHASVPLVPSTRAMAVFLKLRSHPRLDNADGWRARPVTELHATNEKREMLFDREPDGVGTWPVYKGESFDIWSPDTGTYYAAADEAHITAYLQRKRLRQQKLARSAFSAFPRAWAQDPGTLPCLHPRIAFRDITRATDTRTVRAALIPPNVVITNKGPHLLWSSGDATDEAYLLGVLSSIPLDWYARRVVELGLNFHIFNGFPVPRPPSDDPLRSRVVEIAGGLASVDDRYSAWAADVGVPVGAVSGESEKLELVCELDAAVARLYGLEIDDVAVIFETFHEGWNYKDRFERVAAHMARLHEGTP